MFKTDRYQMKSIFNFFAIPLPCGNSHHTTTLKQSMAVKKLLPLFQPPGMV